MRYGSFNIFFNIDEIFSLKHITRLIIIISPTTLPITRRNGLACRTKKNRNANGVALLFNILEHESIGQK
jgi:hypothetical protein